MFAAVGRSAYTEKLGLDTIGIEVDERGRIEVNEHLQTSVPHVYAIGDVVRGAMLAHKAEEEGVFVAEHMAGQKPHQSQFNRVWYILGQRLLLLEKLKSN